MVWLGTFWRVGLGNYFSCAFNSPSALFQTLVWNRTARLVCFKISTSRHASQDWKIPATIIWKVVLNISDCVPDCKVGRHSKEFRCTLQPPETHSSELLISLDTWNADNEFVCTARSSTRANQNHSSLCCGRRILKLLFWNSPLATGRVRSSRAQTAAVPFKSLSF